VLDEGIALEYLFLPRDSIELDFLEQQVRVARVSQGDHMQLEIDGVADPTVIMPHIDYDEVATLGFYVCRTVADSSRGILFPDLANNAGVVSPAALCPGASSTIRASSHALQVASRVVTRCSGACLRTTPPAEIFNWIAEALVDPGHDARAPVWVDRPGLEPRPAILWGSHLCWAGHESEVYNATWRQTQ
jgi:hypothetical protein